MNISLNLKNIRKQKGLTQRALATKSKLSESFICQIEKGKHRDIGYDSLAALAKALGVKLDHLLKEAA